MRLLNPNWSSQIPRNTSYAKIEGLNNIHCEVEFSQPRQTCVGVINNRTGQNKEAEEFTMVLWC
jgi:hypothetical protein